MGCKDRRSKKDRNIVEGINDKFDHDEVLGADDFDGRCVCDVVRAIDDAQENAIEMQCDVSCDKSIKNLVSPVRDNDFDTVPFILYCEGTCKPFKGFGADTQMYNSQMRFDCVSSFIFRVSEVYDDCCARLELLTFDCEPDEEGNQKGAEYDKDPCDQLDGQKTDDLEGTGICITVDLNDFVAITCLPAVDLF